MAGPTRVKKKTNKKKLCPGLERLFIAFSLCVGEAKINCDLEETPHHFKLAMKALCSALTLSRCDQQRERAAESQAE